MKKIDIVFVIALLIAVLAISTTGVAADISIKICIDDRTVEFNNSSGNPFADSNGRTQVPFRITLEKFGAKVGWNQETKTAIAEKDGIKVEVPIGEKYIVKNGQKIDTDTAALIKDSKTYLPIRSVIEALGGTVDWDNTTKTVIIKNIIKEVSELIFDTKYMVVNINKTKELTVKVLPTDVNDKYIKWTSSNSNIVSIENGLVTGKALGKATITATSNNGKSASVDIYAWNEESTEVAGFIQETNNFVFHYKEIDRDIIYAYALAVESEYDRITNAYVGHKIPVVHVYVQPSVKEHHAETNRRKNANFTYGMTSVGTVIGSDLILIASPKSPDNPHPYNGMIKVIVHEFVHIATRVINPNLRAQWLSEGVACYDSNQFALKDFNGMYAKGNLPGINGLVFGIEYSMGYVLTDFIINNWGREGLNNLIKNDGDILSTFGISVIEFENQWHQYIRDKYIKTK